MSSRSPSCPVLASANSTLLWTIRADKRQFCSTHLRSQSPGRKFHTLITDPKTMQTLLKWHFKVMDFTHVFLFINFKGWIFFFEDTLVTDVPIGVQRGPKSETNSVIGINAYFKAMTSLATQRSYVILKTITTSHCGYFPAHQFMPRELVRSTIF